MIESLLHALTCSKVSYQWGGKQQFFFDTLKQKIFTSSILALPDLQEPFKIETYASGYAMGEVLLKKRNLFFFIQKTFSKEVANYPTYDKELFALV